MPAVDSALLRSESGEMVGGGATLGVVGRNRSFQLEMLAMEFPLPGKSIMFDLLPVKLFEDSLDAANST